MSIKSLAIRSIIAAAIVAAPLAAHAQFGGLFGGGGNKSSGNVGAEVEKFMAAASDANMLTGNALTQLVSAIAVSGESTSLSEAAKDAAATTNPEEKNAKMGKVNADAAIQLQKILASKEAQDKIASLDSDKKSKIGKSFFNYVLGVLRTKDVIPTGQNVIKSVAANPMDLPKVAVVKDVLPHLQSIASNSIDLMKAIPAFFKQAGISFTMPTGSNEKAQDYVTIPS